MVDSIKLSHMVGIGQALKLVKACSIPTLVAGLRDLCGFFGKVRALNLYHKMRDLPAMPLICSSAHRDGSVHTNLSMR